jgi:hypothetical protein
MSLPDRRFVLTAAIVGLAAVACDAAGKKAGVAPAAAAAATATTRPMPAPNALEKNLLVGFCGAPGSPSLGRMTGDLTAAVGKLQRQIQDFPRIRPITPVLELIATTVHRTPGPDGMYRSRCKDTTVRQYLDAARAVNGQLLLNIQPGRADFLPEVRAYEHWLMQPDVGVALDPEWAVEPGVIPGHKFGRTSGAELDEVARYLGALAETHGLPAKIMIYHQVAASIVRGETQLQPHAGVSVVKVVDGIGSAADKKATWATLMKTKPAHARAGFKLFFDEDARHGDLMTPAEVLALNPTPSYVLYE